VIFTTDIGMRRFKKLLLVGHKFQPELVVCSAWMCWMWMVVVASWLTINQVQITRTENRKIRECTLLYVGKPTKRDKRKLWEPALPCEDLTACIRNSLVLWQPCVAEIYTSSKLMDHFSAPVRYTDTMRHTIQKLCDSEKQRRNSV